jgi:hypothetical protein
MVLHLAPAAVTFAGTLLLAPVLAKLGLPCSFAVTVAFALLLTPIELGLLLGLPSSDSDHRRSAPS